MSAAKPGLAELLGSWRVDPSLVVALALAAGCYAAGVLRARRAGRRWPLVRAACFMAGLATLALALLSGIDAFSERLLSVHMVQHVLLILVAPVLLLSGAPVRLVLAGAPRTGRGLSRLLHRRAPRTLAHPLAGLAALAAVTLLTHLTGVYELALGDPVVHALEHAAYFWAGLLFLAPLISPDPLPRRPDPVTRFAWLMAGMVVMAVPGALLAFQTTVRYPSYLAAARSLRASALADQHLAGAIMWIGGGLAMLALAAATVTGALLAEERRQRRRDEHLLDGGAIARPREVTPR